MVAACGLSHNLTGTDAKVSILFKISAGACSYLLRPQRTLHMQNESQKMYK